MGARVSMNKFQRNIGDIFCKLTEAGTLFCSFSTVPSTPLLALKLVSNAVMTGVRSFCLYANCYCFFPNAILYSI